MSTTQRKGFIERTTKETAVKLELSIEEQEGVFQGSSGIGFLDHMLELMIKHSCFYLRLDASGDLDVDAHHTVEDIGLCMGRAFRGSLGEKKGIARYGSTILPMDEALLLCAVDLSGRAGFYSSLNFPTEKIGTFDCQLIQVFWQAFTQEAKVTLHLQQLAGDNSHHLAEAVFKGIGRILRKAVRLEGEGIPSSKGLL